MSRRKVRGLTRTGRQVSEDPDLDNLLSNLSPEEMEELEKEVMTVPDPDPGEGRLLVPGAEAHEKAPPTANNIEDSSSREREIIKPSRRESCSEEPKKESRKQEYLRKMGLSQEGRDDPLQRQTSVSSDQGTRPGDRTSPRPDGVKEERPGAARGLQGPPGAASSYRRSDSRVPAETTDKQEDVRMKERRENRESMNSKTKDMISKLQGKNDEAREKDRKEESKRRDLSKTKELISKLQQSQDGKKDRKEDFKSKGVVSKMLERQSQVEECKAENKKTKEEEKDQADEQVQRQTSLEKGKSDVEERGKEREKEEGEKEKEEEEEEKEKGKEREKDEEGKKKVEDTELKQGMKRVQEKDPEESKTNEQSRGTGQKAGPESAMEEEGQNCVENKNSKTKEEDEDEEDSSMFDELTEQVRNNDPSVSEINVNNSEVIKTKTLIQFAEALHANTHIKAFALANCRADDHVAYAIAGALRANKTLTSVNLDSNHLTGKGIIALIRALQNNATLTELRFHNQRHICGGKTEMEMTKVLKDNTTLLKLGYQFELAGPRMTMTNILSRNMDRQRQRRFQEQKLAQANGDKKGTLEVPKPGGLGSLRGSPMPSPKPSPLASPMPSPKLTPKRISRGGAPPPPPPPPGGGPPPPPPPPPPPLNMDSLKNSLTPVAQRRLEGKAGGAAGGRNTRDQLLASIRDSTKMTLKKVAVPKLLQ